MLLASAAAAALTAMSAGSASALDTWTGATSNDWTVGTNWADGTAPTATDDVNINTAGAVLGVNGAATGATESISVGAINGSTADLTIQNGSTLTTTEVPRIATASGSTGTVTVTGSGSQWLIPNFAFYVGFSANATLNIQNGARVYSAVGTIVGNGAASSGTVNISGGGTLETRYLRGGTGGSQANFDNGILKATANNLTFINGFSGTGLNILAGGLTIDTAGFAVATDVASAFTGTGGLTVTGGGVFDLLSNSSYAGATRITSGSSLSLQGAGAIASSSRVIADGTFNVFGIAAAGTNIRSLAGSGAVALGAKDLTITNANDLFSGIISGSGGLTLGGGAQTLSGANNYTGATTVNGGTLRAGAANTFSAASAYSVLAGGTLDLAGFSQTLASLDNAGTVNLRGSSGTLLTIAGNYIGSGGVVSLNTVLGNDASATDRLVVQGDTSGSSTLRVTNVGGTGARTVKGIKVIDIAGASNGTFALQGNYVFLGQQAVVGGAYAYTLQEGSDGDWYLRSSLSNPPAPGPLYQPGVPLYENYGQVLLGMNDLPSLQQRVANRYWGGSDAMARAGVAPSQTSSSAAPSAFWGRIEGGRSDLQPSNTAGSTYKSDQVKMQTGLDGLALENERGRLIVSLTAQYGLTTANVASFYGNGRIRVEGSGVGGTLTWYGDNGFYVDGQAQTMFYRSDLSSALAGSMTHGNQGFGYAFSAETGKRFAVGNGWSLTPQAQLGYSKVDFDSFADRFGAVVALRNADSLLGRAGLSLNHQKTWNDGAGIVHSDVYGLANLRYEFLNGTNVDVAGTSFASANDRLWGSIGGGGSYSWANGRYTVFGEVTYNASLSHSSDNHSYKGTGGFRATW